MSLWVPVSLAGAFIGAQWIATEWFAWRLGFNPSLGKALGGFIYWPWSWAVWVWQFLEPAQRLAGRPYAVYPHEVYDALQILAYVLAGGFVACVTVAAIVTMPKKANDEHDLYDSGSKWADEKTARADRLLGARAGPVIGGFENAFGKVVPLRYEGQLGLSYVEPPGGGKSAFLTSNLLIPLQHADAQKWDEKARRVHPWGEEPVVLVSDPKFELFKQTSGYQRRVLGKDTFLLAPLGAASDMSIANDQLACYNPFWNVRLGTERGFQDCYFRTLAIVDAEGEGLKTHWDRTSLSWGAAAIEKLGYRAMNTGDYESFSLPGLLDFVSSFASMDALLQYMLTEPDDPIGAFGWQEAKPDGSMGPTRVKPSVQQAAREMLNKDPRERAGVYSTFVAFLAPYRSEILRRFITRSSFDWSALANDRDRAATVYISMDPMDLPKLRPYLRQVIGAAVEELTSGGTMDVGGRSARGNYRPVVLTMDEVAAWRKLAEIEHGSGYFRGYGIMLWLIWQSVAQQKKYYGKENLLDETMDVLLYGRPKKSDGAEEISKMLGETTHLVRKRSVAGGRFALIAPQAQDSIEPMKMPVLSEKNIMQIDKDRYIGFYNGHNYYLKKWEYYKNKALSERAKLPYSCRPQSEAFNLPIFVNSVYSVLSKEDVARLKSHVAAKAEKPPVPEPDAAAAAAQAAIAQTVAVSAQSPVEAYLRAAQRLREKRAAEQTDPALLGAAAP